MIKVNLLKNIALTKAGGVADVSATNVQRQALTKLLAIIFLPAMLIVVEKFKLNALTEQVDVVEQKIRGIEASKAQFGEAGPKIEKYSKEKKRIDQEMDVIRGIAKTRLREVKALDSLQSLIPQRTWFDTIEISGTLIKLLGYTTSDAGVADLIKALESSPYFSKVEPKSTSQENLPSGPAKKFEIEFRIGKDQAAPGVM